MMIPFKKTFLVHIVSSTSCILFSARIGFLVIIIQMSCSSAQVDLHDYVGPQLIFGSGGGVSGGTVSYILLENGQLFKLNSLLKDTVALQKLSKKEAKDLFRELEELHIEQIDFNHPGNLYYFIENKQGNKNHRVVWGSNEHPPPSSVKNFYYRLQDIIPKNSP